MAKQRKNSNYVTEKTIAKKQMQEMEMKKQERNRLIAWISIVSAVVLAVVALIVVLVLTASPKVTHHATIELYGYDSPIHIELYGELAPETVENFVKLAQDKKYDGKTFHRIIKNFMMQGGDGASDKTIKGEFKANGFENTLSHTRGVISMARAGSATSGFDTACDQFFIMQKDNTDLDGYYAAFGRVIDGMDIVDQICNNTPVIDANGTVHNLNQPLIKSISIHEAH